MDNLGLPLISCNSNELMRSQPHINYGSSMEIEPKDEFDIFEFLNPSGDQRAQLQYVEENHE